MTPIRHYAELVAELRDLQRRYEFAGNASLLQSLRAAEREVDRLTREVLDQVEPPELPGAPIVAPWPDPPEPIPGDDEDLGPEYVP